MTKVLKYFVYLRVGIRYNMERQEALRFYDSRYLAGMSKELLSAYLPGEHRNSRLILGCSEYPTQMYNQYSEPQQMLIMRYSIDMMSSVIENCAKKQSDNEAYIQKLEEENLRLRQQNESINQQNEEKLEKLLAELKEARTSIKKLKNAEKKHPVNSENSNLPPSQNTIGEKARIRKKNVSLREESNKPNGGQAGHKGKTLHRTEPDKKMRIYPDKTLPADSKDTSDVICPVCGSSIPRSLFKEKQVRQLIDILDEIKASVVDYTTMEAECPSCGSIVSGKFGPYLQGNVNYGPRFQALVTLLSVRHSVAENRICEIISDLYGVKLNEGTVCNMLQRQTSYSRTEWYHLHDDLCDSKNGIVAVHADETHGGHLYQRTSNTPNASQAPPDSPPDKIETDSQTSGTQTNTDNKVKALPIWIWTFQNNRSIFLKHNMSRSGNLITELFENGFPDKILITDRYRGYFTDEVLVGGHQICLVHLLRNIKYKMEIYPRLSWLSVLFETLQQVIHRYHQQEDKMVLYDFYKKKLHGLLYEETQKVELPDESAVIEIENFKKELRAHENHMLTFLTMDGVFPTNNTAEVSLRPTKTKLKVSGNFRTEYGSYMYAVNP